MTGGPLSPLGRRVLLAADGAFDRTPARIGILACCETGLALVTLQELRGRGLVEPVGSSPRRWRRTPAGDLALEDAS